MTYKDVGSSRASPTTNPAIISRIGIIYPMRPNPKIFFGNILQVKEFLGMEHITHRIITKGDLEKSELPDGWRVMTEEEEITYYEPPPLFEEKIHKLYEANRYGDWKLTLFKEWKKGEPYPTDPSLKFSGTVTEFKNKFNVNKGALSRFITTHEGTNTGQPIYTLNGWRIARVRRNATIH